MQSQKQSNSKNQNIIAALFGLGITCGIAFYFKTKKKQESQPIVDNDGNIIDLSDAQWREFWENGFVKIGKTLSKEELNQLRQRLFDIMKGKKQYGDQLMMQLDPGGNEYDYHEQNVSVQGQTSGFKGDTLNYRKIGEAGFGLECDDLFLSYIRKNIFENICKRIYGNHSAISAYRAMMFNKPLNEKGGTVLPWHQDGGNWWGLDRDPLIFCWTALYPVTKESGCVQVIKKSYKLGILTESGHMLNEQDIQKYCNGKDSKYEIVDLVCDEGETWLVHNWTIHTSGQNKSNVPRWAFSCNYIDARTKVLNPKPSDAGPIGKPGQSFPVVFDKF